MGGVNKRKGLVTGTESSDEYFTVYADVSYFILRILFVQNGWAAALLRASHRVILLLRANR